MLDLFKILGMNQPIRTLEIHKYSCNYSVMAWKAIANVVLIFNKLDILFTKFIFKNMK